jgi:hypothetical protein
MGSLDDRPSAVAKSFKSIADSSFGFTDIFLFALMAIHPYFGYIPTPRRRAIEQLGDACTDLSRIIINRARAEEKGERSIMGLLGKYLSPSKCESLSSSPCL